jgi:hypothetical protein
MGRRTVLSRNHTYGRSSREGGYSLIELTLTLVLLMAIALFGLQTMVSGSTMQNWSIGQSMTDAYAGIETAWAQREVFANITTDGRWGIYPAAITTAGVQIGMTPFRPVTVTVIRTYHSYILDPDTGALSYLLESYVVYQDGPRKYCKVSKVYRSQ